MSKLTTHALGTPSAPGVRSTSDVNPRPVRVSAATTTESIRAAAGRLFPRCAQVDGAGSRTDGDPSATMAS